jgi:hypothetical protein
MSNGLFIAGTYPAKRQITEETIHMKAIVLTDQAAGTAGMKLVERPEPQAAINDAVVQVHASGFTDRPERVTDLIEHSAIELRGRKATGTDSPKLDTVAKEQPLGFRAAA